MVKQIGLAVFICLIFFNYAGASAPICNNMSAPGGDHPDETFSADAGNPPAEPPFVSDHNAIAFKTGFYENLTSLLNKAKSSYVKADIDTPVTDLLAASKLLVIPSGGLYGMEKSAFFKATLDEYVKQGGTLIVFAQQHGYEFGALPVPPEPDGTYRQVGGYGWQEDQSCYANSVYINTYHQILSGQNRSTPTLNVDGYFTEYPSSATVLLRRTANGQPAMLMYDYGLGKVIVTSMYSDYAYGHSQASSEEIALVRDMVSWAKAPAQLPEVRPGDAVSLTLNMTNLTNTPATSAKVQVYSPDRSTLLSEQVINVPIPAGQIANIPVAYQSATRNQLGIYHVDYALLDASGNIIQPQAETDSGRFAVSNPPLYTRIFS